MTAKKGIEFLKSVLNICKKFDVSELNYEGIHVAFKPDTIVEEKTGDDHVTIAALGGEIFTGEDNASIEEENKKSHQ